MAPCRSCVGALLAAATLALAPTLVARAEVATDGTLGARVKLTGREVTVPARLGQARGRNLFHSFARFGVPSEGRVTFTGPDGLKNVIARVTGGAPSKIDGTLASKVQGADLWLLNPAGLLFGPNAELDVRGSFHASTADELRFADGAVFSALNPAGSVLSVAAPEAFGFLGAKPPGPITVDRSVLEVPKGKALSLVGGDIAIQGDNDGDRNAYGLADEPGTVRAEAGRVSLAALGGAGAVAAGTNEATGEVSGRIQLAGDASVVASGDGRGTVRIHGGQVVVTGSSRVLADNLGSTHSVGGVVVAANTLEVSKESLLAADTFGPGKAGTVRLQADALELHRGGEITSSTIWGTGDAGEVVVNAGRLLIDSRGSMLPTFIAGLASASTGDAGQITVQAGTLEIRGDGEITSSTFGTGDAGAVAVQAGTLELRENGRITSDTGGPGDAGSIVVNAEHLVVAGDAAGSAPGIYSNAIREVADPGDAGAVTIKADTIELSDGGWIGTNTEGPGNGGRTSVEAGTFELRDGYVTSNTIGSGDAGTVTIKADALALRHGGTISSKTQNAGDAGMVRIAADSVALHDRGAISSATEGLGAAGGISVTAARGMSVADGSEVTTSSVASGLAGNVAIQASRLVARNGAEIGSSGLGSGAAGDVRVGADTLLVEKAGIRTEGMGAEGGRINIAASDLISLDDAEVTSNGIESAAGKSVIRLEAPLIALNGSRVTSLTGNGGPAASSGLAQLAGDQTVISADSVVEASSNVMITGLENEIGSRLAAPEGAFLNAGDLLRESCSAGRSETASTFTAMGRGGLPPDPAAPLAGAYREQGGAAATDQAGPVLAGSFGEGCRRRLATRARAFSGDLRPQPR
jgi:filamentous hemagglutinin family protein